MDYEMDYGKIPFLSFHKTFSLSSLKKMNHLETWSVLVSQFEPLDFFLDEWWSQISQVIQWEIIAKMDDVEIPLRRLHKLRMSPDLPGHQSMNASHKGQLRKVCSVVIMYLF